MLGLCLVVGGSVREVVSRLENEGRRKRGLGSFSIWAICSNVLTGERIREIRMYLSQRGRSVRKHLGVVDME